MTPSDSVFDADAFLGDTSSDALDTVYVPIPAGTYVATVDDIVVRTADTKRGQQVVADILWAIDNPQLAAEMGRDKLTVKQGLFLDTVVVNGATKLDFGKGKNVGLGKIRDALGQNNPGQSWNPGMLKGAGPAQIKVVQNPDKTGEVYANVKSVGKLG